MSLVFSLLSDQFHYKCRQLSIFFLTSFIINVFSPTVSVLVGDIFNVVSPAPSFLQYQFHQPCSLLSDQFHYKCRHSCSRLSAQFRYKDYKTVFFRVSFTFTTVSHGDAVVV